jgi:hypothetical protein
MKKIKNEDKVYGTCIGLFSFLMIVLKKLYRIKGFVSFISGLCVFNCIIKVYKILTNRRELNRVTYMVFGDEKEKKKDEKKEDRIFGFDMRVQQN